MFTQYVQYFLLYLLWDLGLQLDESSEMAAANPGKMYIQKHGAVSWDLMISQTIAVAAVFFIIGIDLLQHLNVMASLNEYFRLMARNGLLAMFIIHTFMIVLQCQYALILAYYSFYVIF
jgi:hypothetical protein